MVAVVDLLAGACAKVPARAYTTDAVHVSESTAWQGAMSPVLPEYPAASIAARREGRVVVAVGVDTAGRIDSYELLESPDADIAEATRQALTKWRFLPTTEVGRAEPLRKWTKLTFYFRLQDGRPVVQGSPERIAERIAGGELRKVETR
jgi:TonB family protein